MAGRKAAAGPPPITASFLDQLRECLAERRIQQGLACLHRCEDRLTTANFKQADTARLIGHLAQWADIESATLGALRRILSSFGSEQRSALTFRDYLYLRMADGMLAMADEEIESALRHFNFVLDFPEEFSDPQSMSIVLFWKARCLRRRGEYEQALLFAHQGRDSALKLGLPRMAALSQVLESWLLFQKGKLKEAERISKEAESILRD